MRVHQWYHGVYAQDTWRATSRVTVNAGLRWEPFFGQNVTRGAIYDFDRDNFTKNVKSTVFINAPAGLIYPGDPGFPAGTVGPEQAVVELLAARRRAWDVRGDGRMAVRSSYALIYDFPTGEYLHQPRGRAAVRQPLAHQRSAGTLRRPVPRRRRRSAPDRHRPAIRVYPVGGRFGAMDPDINSPRIQ